jgi:hypothetical protein
MTITRKGLHAEISRLDEIIDAANNQKAEQFKEYRDQMSDNGDAKIAIKSEIEAFKKAVRKLRTLKKKGDEVVEQQEELVDEIILEIQRPKSGGTEAATRVRIAREAASVQQSLSPSCTAIKQAQLATEKIEQSTKEESTTEFSAPSSPSPSPHDEADDVDSPCVGEPESEPAGCRPLVRSGEGEPIGDVGLHAGSPSNSLDEIPEFLRRPLVAA